MSPTTYLDLPRVTETDFPASGVIYYQPTNASSGITIGSALSTDALRQPFQLHEEVIDALAKSTRRSWFRRLRQALDGISRLPPNWDSQGAKPPTSRAVNSADSVLRSVWEWGAKPERIAPTSSSGIMISYFGSHGRANIECLPSGAVLVAVARNDAEIEVLEFEHDALEHIESALLSLAAAIAPRPAMANASEGSAT